ncbi:hypothetical protein [Flavobacterium olei]|uniref:hypothetical protein n=1 Tax=Flavobacterium olei TaxID=1886782 RepID=UPI00321AC843
MKKIFLISAVFAINMGYAQNIFESSSGNVGIGTNQPGAKLEVFNNAKMGHLILSANDSPNADLTRIDIDFNVANQYHTVGRISSYYLDSANGGSGGLKFFTRENSVLNEKMNISHNGDVGIGISPSAKLDVYGTIKSYEPLALGNTINSFQLINERGGNVGENTIINRLWTFRDGTLNNWYNSRLHDGISIDNSFKTPNVDTKTWWERDPLDNIQSWGTDAQTYLTINKGNIGIGTINPKNKLDVNGTIHSKEVKVDMDWSWPDFVFKKEYKLPTLQEVEKHIKEKGHLENIPSEKEVLENGINLGEINAKLLQKIEELTLYLINKDKQINYLLNENTLIKKNNDDLNKSLLERVEKLEANITNLL